jgi:hypothetical protein
MQKSKTPRRTRPEPERTQPERAWKRTEPAREAKGAAHEANGAARESNGAGPAPEADGARSSAYRTLNDAYRLVDEYLRQGQEMAENIWLPLGGNGASGLPTPGAPERFLRAVGDMTLAWVEAMQGFTNASTAAQQPNGSAGPFQTAREAASHAPSPTASTGGTPTAGHAPEAQVATRRELGVSVEAKGRVAVTAALTDRGVPGELEVSELRPAKGNAASIRDVSVRADEALVVVSIVVPDAQPPGTYNGLLLDAKTQAPRGTLSVVVL